MKYLTAVAFFFFWSSLEFLLHAAMADPVTPPPEPPHPGVHAAPTPEADPNAIVTLSYFELSVLITKEKQKALADAPDQCAAVAYKKINDALFPKPPIPKP